jgi:gluconate 2-dehydrogenase gamma chain
VTRLVLDEHEWATLEAAMARIIPTDDAPGAREAGTIVWLDRYLSGIGYVHATPDGRGFVTLVGKEAEAWASRIEELRTRYREGVATLDRVSRRRFAREFRSLDDAEQDRILTALEAGDLGDDDAEAAGSAALVPKRTQAAVDEDGLPFFALLAVHTRQAFYSDPVYGGNRDHVGWKLVGFHGPASMAEALEDLYTTDDYLA